MSIVLPAPDPAILARRDDILAGLRKAAPGVMLIVSADERRRPLLEDVQRRAVAFDEVPVVVHPEPLAEHRQGLVVVPLVVELVRALVVLLGTQERRGHRASDLRLKGGPAETT